MFSAISANTTTRYLFIPSDQIEVGRADQLSAICHFTDFKHKSTVMISWTPCTHLAFTPDNCSWRVLWFSQFLSYADLQKTFSIMFSKNIFFKKTSLRTSHSRLFKLHIIGLQSRTSLLSLPFR